MASQVDVDDDCEDEEDDIDRLIRGEKNHRNSPLITDSSSSDSSNEENPVENPQHTASPSLIPVRSKVGASARQLMKHKKLFSLHLTLSNHKS